MIKIGELDAGPAPVEVDQLVVQPQAVRLASASCIAGVSERWMPAPIRPTSSRVAAASFALRGARARGRGVRRPASTSRRRAATDAHLRLGLASSACSSATVTAIAAPCFSITGFSFSRSLACSAGENSPDLHAGLLRRVELSGGGVSVDLALELCGLERRLLQDLLLGRRRRDQTFC